MLRMDRARSSRRVPLSSSTTETPAVDFTPTAGGARSGDRAAGPVRRKRRRHRGRVAPRGARALCELPRPARGRTAAGSTTTRTWRSRSCAGPRTAVTVPDDSVRHAEPRRRRSRARSPALQTENAGGLVHLGATLLEAEDGARGDARVVVLPLADAAAQAGAARRAQRDRRVAHRQVRCPGDRVPELRRRSSTSPTACSSDAPIQLVFANSEAQDDAVFPPSWW